MLLRARAQFYRVRHDLQFTTKHEKKPYSPAPSPTEREGPPLSTALTLLASTAFAGEVTINVSSVVNEPWTYQTIPNPGTFPVGYQNPAGIPFEISTAPNNVWLGRAAANSGPGTVAVTIPIGVEGVTTVFTLLNTFWGQPGPATFTKIRLTEAALSRLGPMEKVKAWTATRVSVAACSPHLPLAPTRLSPRRT